MLLALSGAVLALAGCDTDAAVAPDAPDPLFASAHGEPWTMAPLTSFADMSMVGKATIRRNSEGFTAFAEHDGLGVRSAVTVWAVVFNSPGACAAHPDPCMEADLFTPEVRGDVLRLAGNVVSGRKDKVGGTLREGDTSESIAHLLGLPAVGVDDAMTAEVHLVFRSHGPPLAGMVDDQILSVLGGCATELPRGMIPTADGECSDVAFAIFQ